MLFRSLGVSRQAVYDWQHGKPIAPENLRRIEAAAHAADVVATSGLPAIARTRKFNGKTLADIAFDGGNAEFAVARLVRVLQQEAEQRELLRKAVANVERRPLSASDFGTPAYREEG